jgi:hypothetical protein
LLEAESNSQILEELGSEQNSQELQMSLAKFSQFTALANNLANVVLPTPLIPVKRIDEGILFIFIEFLRIVIATS